MPAKTKRLSPLMTGTLADVVQDRSLVLLSTGFASDPCTSWLQYREALRKLGYVDGTGRLAASRYESDLFTYLATNGCQPQGFGLDDWWLQITRRSSGQHHVPVQHLLLQAFIANQQLVVPAQTAISGEPSHDLRPVGVDVPNR